MRFRRRRGAAWLLTCVLWLSKTSAAEGLAPPLSEGWARHSEIGFEPNRGQTSSEVRFYSRSEGYTLFLTNGEAVLVLDRASNDAPGAVIRMQLIGSNPTSVSGFDELSGKSNYFLGNDPSKWRTAVPRFARVRYRDVYPGVDLIYYRNQGKLEFDFVLAPGADPGAIRMRFDGANGTALDSEGALVLETDVGRLRLETPTIYQDTAGGKKVVDGHYIVEGKDVEFVIASYDRDKPLILDPVLSYSTYLGGSSFDWLYDVAVDASGTYITGVTASLDFPTSNPYQAAHGGTNQDAFVTKLSPEGDSIVYSTYLGGSDIDAGYGIAVDHKGQAHIAGRTSSTDFPIANAAQAAYGGDFSDGFVTSLTPSGDALVYSTFLGGSGLDSAYDIAVDMWTAAYVTGETSSNDFPTANPLQAELRVGPFGSIYDAFITKLDASGSNFEYSTYLGGYGLDSGQGIAVNIAGSAYVVGETKSDDFPTSNPLQPFRLGSYDLFVSRLSSSGSMLVYSTYLGGSSIDTANDIAVDAAGNAYVTGSTSSTDWPLENPLQATYGGGSDAFVSKIDKVGSQLVYSTYLGGSEVEWGRAIAVDAIDRAFVTGTTRSTDFPLASPLQSGLGGGTNGVDAFLSQLDSSGSSLVFSTYLGGSDSDNGRGVAVDKLGNAYVVGRTYSSDFPMSSALFPTISSSQEEGFVVKVAPDPWVLAAPGHRFDWRDNWHWMLLCFELPPVLPGVGPPQIEVPSRKCPPPSDCPQCFNSLSKDRHEVRIPPEVQQIYRDVLGLFAGESYSESFHETATRLVQRLRKAPSGMRFTERIRADVLESLERHSRARRASPPLMEMLVEAVNAIELDLRVPPLAPREVKEGETAEVDLGGVAQLTFREIETPGRVSLTLDAGLPAIANGLAPAWPIVSYRFEFDGTLSQQGYVDVTVSIAGFGFDRALGPSVRLMEWDGESYQDVTTRVDTRGGFITGRTRSLSTLAVMTSAPNARSVER